MIAFSKLVFWVGYSHTHVHRIMMPVHDSEIFVHVNDIAENRPMPPYWTFQIKPKGSVVLQLVWYVCSQKQPCSKVVCILPNITVGCRRSIKYFFPFFQIIVFILNFQRSTRKPYAQSIRYVRIWYAIALRCQNGRNWSGHAIAIVFFLIFGISFSVLSTFDSDSIDNTVFLPIEKWKNCNSTIE